MNDLMNVTEERASAAVENGQAFLGYTEKEMEPEYSTTLEHIERIIEYTEALGINNLLFERAGSRIGIVAERLSLSPMQTVLFSLLFSRYNNDSLSQDDLVKLFHCSSIKLLHYMNDLEELAKKKLIEAKFRRKDTLVYRIPMEVVNTLRKKDVFVPDSRENLGIDEFFGILEDLFEQFDSNELNSTALYDEVMDMVNHNMHLLFCQKIMSYDFSRENAVLLICFCHLYVNNFDDHIGFHDFEFLYDKKSRARMVRREFVDGDHCLIEAKFIENTNDEGFVNRGSFRLTDNAKKDLLGELDIKEFQVRVKRGLVAWNSLPEKKLFYNEGEKRRIAELTSLLEEENFRAVQERLVKSGMRKGFACLFSGAPGTGKTETVYQIARATGRDIMMVDMASIKNMYVGETEKHIKAVFDDYRKTSTVSGRMPILFFNEADAIIGKRIEFDTSSRSVDRMENTMQNIILQEMEALDGILIAATNLTKNMDGAFERRFLYRIEFEKPDPAARASIWRTMLAEIGAAGAEELAARFELSGGQIENVARRCTVNMVLSGRSPGMDDLASFCREELVGKDGTERRIGFGR
ncbi:MAG: ATP-binding protein [Treponema sp.]|nr:ATP-binding protein [Treponema sp.]